MADEVKEAWGGVGAAFSNLGRAMRDRYRSGGRDEESTPERRAGSEDALRESFERLVSAGREVGQRTADVVRDEAVNEQAKQAATSLNDALSATVEMIGREVAGWFGRPSASDDEPTVVGVPDDVPPEARPSTTGLVTDSPDTGPDVDVADVDPGSGSTTPPQ
jgi:hypothetical protein